MIQSLQRFLITSIGFLTFIIIVTATVSTAQQAFTTEDALNVRNISIADFTDDGEYVAILTSTRKNRMNVNHDRFGDPTYIAPRTFQLIVIHTQSGEEHKLFDEDVQVRQVTWSDDGTRLAFFKLEDDRYQLYIYDSRNGKSKRVKLKSELEISSNSVLEWRPDSNEIIIELRAKNWRDKARAAYLELEEGPIITQYSKNDFLAWERVWNIDGLEILAKINLGDGSVTELTPETEFGGLNQAEDGSYLTYIEVSPQKTDYKREGDSEYALLKLDFGNANNPDTVIRRTDNRLRLNWNHSGNMFAYSEEGKIYLQSVTDEEPLHLTKDFEKKVEEGDTTKISYSIERWHPEDTHLLLQSDKGYHLIDLRGEKLELVFETPEDEKNAPRRDIEYWSSDGRYLYMTYSARDHWERGLTRFDLQKREMEQLQIDDKLYSGWCFAKNGNRMIFEASNGDLPTQLFTADLQMNDIRQLTNFNQWLSDRALTRSELIQYMDVDGDTLYGILYYPVNYEEGKKYPLVANVYEDFFHNGFNTRMNLIANAGFFGFRPSVNFETGYPGEAWLKGVTTGINKLIERGLVDGSKLGVQGTSYGGYAVNLLITQTDRFAAAVNISGKVNMISFLGDSPKITTRNYDAAEVGQDRIGETFWEAPDKYIAHSAVFFADRIETPLLLLSGEGDWNVPATNQREMYYALRRLGKEVKWIHYMRAGHGAGRNGTEEDFHHHWRTVIDWYNSKFFGKDDDDDENMISVEN